MKIANARHLGSILTLVAALLTQVACMGAEDADAQGSAVALDRTTLALTTLELGSVNGTYGAGCRNHVGASWSLEIALGAPLDNDPLSVVLNDADCALTLTSLHTDVAGPAGIMMAVPPLDLSTTYAAAASSFGEFYANAKLSSALFADDFVLTVLFSDDPALATAANTASLASVLATAVTSGAVAAPDYTLDVDGLAVLTDAGDIVQSVSGTAALTEVLVAGQEYVVVAAAGLFTYAAIDAAYLAGTPAAITPTIPAAAFTLVGATLTGGTTVRTLIVANTNAGDGVASYQAFEVTFYPAP
jgi:hypothetical protein